MMFVIHEPVCTALSIQGVALPSPMTSVALQDHRARQLGLIPNTMIDRTRSRVRSERRQRVREPGSEIDRPTEYVLDVPPPMTMGEFNGYSGHTL